MYDVRMFSREAFPGCITTVPTRRCEGEGMNSSGRTDALRITYLRYNIFHAYVPRYTRTCNLPNLAPTYMYFVGCVCGAATKCNINSIGSLRQIQRHAIFAQFFVSLSFYFRSVGRGVL